MERLYEIKNVLNFYTYSNKLKNEMIEDDDNYSIADNIFGSMILATAINSEFKETNDLAKIYRMLFLSEFNNLYPNYHLDNFKLGNSFNKKIINARKMNTKDGKLVAKYKLLNSLLTQLIIEKENNISKLELIKEGSTIISSLCGKMPYECKEIFKFYYLNFRLMNKIRSGWDSNHWNIKSDRIETVSEHVVGTISLALILNSEFGYKIDIDKVLKMLVIHETGETIIGDITPFDGITKEEKKEIEHQAMIEALGKLKEKDSLLDLLLEFDEQKTPEAKFSHYCDKIEADLQAKIYQDKGMHHSLNDQKNNVVFNSSRVKQMVKDGAKDAFDIWYEWDKTIYEGDEQFPEFSNVLKIARANNLLDLDMVVKERIDLTDDEHSFLVEEITETIKELYKDDNIDAVYLTNYQDSSKGLLYICGLLNSEANYYDYDDLVEKLNAKISKKNKTDVNVLFGYDYKIKYSEIALNPSGTHRAERLIESTILFDKSGYVSKVKDAMKRHNHLDEFYLVDYIPPVDKAIARQFIKLK